MTTTQYLRVFARFWYVIGLCVVVGAVLPEVVGANTTKIYVSSTGILITGRPATQPSVAEASQVMLLAQQRMATYRDIATTPALSEEVLEGLDTDLSAVRLTENTTAEVQGNSTVLRINIQDTDAHQARMLASRAGEAMVVIINRLEEDQADPTTMLEATIVSEGSAPSVTDTSAWPSPSLGGAAGLLVGMGLAVAISRLDPRLRDPEAVADVVGAPVLGLVPLSQRAGQSQDRSIRTKYDEAVRGVRTSIFFLRKDTGGCLTIAITSPTRGDGLASITSSIAEALADIGSRVLLVEADLADVQVAENADRHEEASGVDVVPAASTQRRGADLLHSKDFATLLTDASERYDYVLVNAPATSQGTDAAVVAARCAVTVLFVKSDTPERQLREGLRNLRGVDADVRGVVLVT